MASFSEYRGCRLLLRVFYPDFEHFLFREISLDMAQEVACLTSDDAFSEAA
jgi:hypothetical protein